MNAWSEKYLFTIFIFLIFSSFPESACAQKKISVSVTIRGVYDSKISLLPLTGKDALKPVFVVDRIANGETASFQISDNILPGEFVLRLDYKGDEASEPYPSRSL